jgi:hypothetical protein
MCGCAVTVGAEAQTLNIERFTKLITRAQECGHLHKVNNCWFYDDVV